MARAKREKRNGRFSGEKANREQGRRNESCDHEYNDDKDGDRYHTQRIQDQRFAWMAQMNSNVNISFRRWQNSPKSYKIIFY